MAQVTWKWPPKAGARGQLPQIKPLQDLTVTAAAYSHDVPCHEAMNTLNAQVNTTDYATKSQGLGFYCWWDEITDYLPGTDPGHD